MPKKPMTLNDLLKKDRYRSIINLLIYFEFQYDPSKDKKGIIETKGLRPFHFRFALMDDPQISESNYRCIKDFFDSGSLVLADQGIYFDDLYNDGTLIKGCIKTPQKLTNYLNKLVDLNIIEKCGGKSFTRYRLTTNYSVELRNIKIIERLKMWKFPDSSESWKFDRSLSEEIWPLDADKGLLCGISRDMLKNSTKDEKEMVINSLKNIYKNLINIMEFKFNKVYQGVDFEKLDFDEIEKEIAKRDDIENWIGFYFGYPIHCFDTLRSLLEL